MILCWEGPCFLRSLYLQRRHGKSDTRIRVKTNTCSSAAEVPLHCGLRISPCCGSMVQIDTFLANFLDHPRQRITPKPSEAHKVSWAKRHWAVIPPLLVEIRWCMATGNWEQPAGRKHKNHQPLVVIFMIIYVSSEHGNDKPMSIHNL